MKKRLMIFCLPLFFTGFVFGQAYQGQIVYSKVPVPGAHYQQEYTFDTTLNVAAWTAQKTGMHVSFASTDELYFRSEAPKLQNETLLWQGTGWKR
ncbi:MAG: hypothetical protein WKG06_37675 [Segetibacter sp.]